MSNGETRPIRSSGLPTRVRLVERIGRGSFGEVWLARDTRDGLDVAVKFLDRGNSESTVDGDRFEREVRSLARVAEIPGIVSIRDLGVAPDGTPWLITEFLAGGTLRFKLDVEAPPPWSTEALAMVEELFLPLASALAGAHAAGVFHGDISPANVLFDLAGRPWLGDLGMAALGGSGMASDGVGGLTPAYSSPERLRGAIPDPRSDVYSLAATLWHVLSGDPRANASAAPETPDMRSDRPGASAIALLESAMDPAPGRRPSAAEIVESLSPRELDRRWWRYRRPHGKR